MSAGDGHPISRSLTVMNFFLVGECVSAVCHDHLTCCAQPSTCYR